MPTAIDFVKKKLKLRKKLIVSTIRKQAFTRSHRNFLGNDFTNHTISSFTC